MENIKDFLLQMPILITCNLLNIAAELMHEKSQLLRFEVEKIEVNVNMAGQIKTGGLIS